MNNNEKYTDEIGISDCCNARTNTIPASFGDPSIPICSNCKSICKKEWKPAFELISPGTYRKIEYIIKQISNK